MGLLDTLTGAGPGGSTGASSGIAKSLLEMISGGQGGGLGGVVQTFQQNGLGKLVESWIGTGQNLPVSPAQVQQVLGPKVQALAQQHGISEEAASQAISQLLPSLVDHLTPGGQLPQGGDALTQGLSALRTRLGI
ncbi:MAG TPA: YidB family protein [Anaeromyxobacteraceae bacterium]